MFISVCVCVGGGRTRQPRENRQEARSLFTPDESKQQQLMDAASLLQRKNVSRVIKLEYVRAGPLPRFPTRDAFPE